MAGIIKHMPGFEPEEIRKELDILFGMIDEEFPDKKIDPSRWNHRKWDALACRLISELGYSKDIFFLSAYGYLAGPEEIIPKSFIPEDDPEDTIPEERCYRGEIVKILKYGKSGFIRNDDDGKDYYFNVRDFKTRENVLEVGKAVIFNLSEKYDSKTGRSDLCAVKIEYVKN